jgi:tryptophan 2,3-dioxygenase
MELSDEILKRVQLLQDKYAAMGQDLASYLDGLLYADYLTYWDYIHLDTLLSLQNPRTSFPDEHIFIMYHQITELYFKLSLHELEQLASRETLDVKFMTNRVNRVNRYFQNLTHSFEVMVDGMDRHLRACMNASSLHFHPTQQLQFQCEHSPASDVNPAMM